MTISMEKKLERAKHVRMNQLRERRRPVMSTEVSEPKHMKKPNCHRCGRKIDIMHENWSEDVYADGKDILLCEDCTQFVQDLQGIYRDEELSFDI